MVNNLLFHVQFKYLHTCSVLSFGKLDCVHFVSVEEFLLSFLSENKNRMSIKAKKILL